MIFLLCAFAAAPPLADPLPEGAVARLGSTRLRHGFMVNSVAFSPDGRTIASGGNGRGLCLWDAATGDLLHHCSTRRFPAAYSVAFSADGKRVAVAESPTLNVVECDTGTVLRQIQAHTNGVISAAYSRFGWVASGSHDLTVRICDPETGATRHVLEGFGGTPWALAPRPTRDELAVGALDGSLSVWGGATGARRWRVAAHTGNVNAAAYSADGATLATAGADGTLRLWAADGTPGRVVAMGGSRPRSVAFSRTHLAAGFDDGTVRLYDPAGGREVRRWAAAPYAVGALAFAPDGRTVASGGPWRSRIDLWDAATGAPLRAARGHVGPVDFLRYVGGTLLSSGRDRELIAWDVGGKVGRSHKLPAGSASLHTVAMSPDGRLTALTSFRERQVRVVDRGTGATVHTFPTQRVKSLAFGAAGRLAAFDDRGELLLWDAAAGKQLLSVKEGLGTPGTGGFWGAMAFAPDGRRLAVGDGAGTVRLVDLADGKVTRRYDAGGEPGGLTFSPDGRTVAICGGYGRPVIILWDSVTGDVVRSWQSEQTGVYSVQFSPDGRLLATAGDDLDSRVFVWEARTGQRVRVFAGHHSAVIPLAFAP
ncbi:MAG: WD40 repeat domain-containing protein, partial [Gemmataceae bacterium]